LSCSRISVVAFVGATAGTIVGGASVGATVGAENGGRERRYSQQERQRSGEQRMRWTMLLSFDNELASGVVSWPWTCILSLSEQQWKQTRQGKREWTSWWCKNRKTFQEKMVWAEFVKTNRNGFFTWWDHLS
jgi:hypothetical protein